MQTKLIVLLFIIVCLIIGCGNAIPDQHGFYMQSDKGQIPIKSYYEERSGTQYQCIPESEIPIANSIVAFYVNMPGINISATEIYWSGKRMHRVYNGREVIETDNCEALEFQTTTIKDGIYKLIISEDVQVREGYVFVRIRMALGTADRLYPVHFVKADQEQSATQPAVVIKTVADLGPPPSISKRKPQIMNSAGECLNAYLVSFQSKNFDTFLRLNLNAQYAVRFEPSDVKARFNELAENQVEVLAIREARREYYFEIHYKIPESGAALQSMTKATDYIVDLRTAANNKAYKFKIQLVLCTEQIANCSQETEYKIQAGEWRVYLMSIEQ